MTIPYDGAIADVSVRARFSDLAVHLRSADLFANGMRGTPLIARTSGALGRDSAGNVYEFPHSRTAIEYFDLDNDGIYETPAFCFDGARTNLCERASALGSWTATNLARTAQVGLGDLPLWRINDTDAVNQGTLDSPAGTVMRFTVGGNGVALFYIAKGDSPAAGGSSLVVRDTTNNANRLNLGVTWVGNTPSINPVGGTHLWQRKTGLTYAGKEVWEIAGKCTGTLTGATDHIVRYIAATTAAQQGDLYVGPAHIEDVATYPLPLVLNGGTGSASYSRDEWRYPHDGYCGAGSILLDLIERGTILENGARVFTLGNNAGGTPEVTVDVSGGKYRLVHHNGTTSVSSALTGTMPSVGDRFQLYGYWDATGAVRLSMLLAGTWQHAAVSGANAYPRNTGWAGWPGAAYFTFGHPYANRQALRVIEAKVATAALSQAQLAGAFG